METGGLDAPKFPKNTSRVPSSAQAEVTFSIGLRRPNRGPKGKQANAVITSKEDEAAISEGLQLSRDF